MRWQKPLARRWAAGSCRSGKHPQNRLRCRHTRLARKNLLGKHAVYFRVGVAATGADHQQLVVGVGCMPDGREDVHVFPPKV